MSWILAVETMNVLEFFALFLWTSCYIMAWFFAVVSPHLVNLFIILVLWASTGVVSHFLTFTTLFLAHVLLLFLKLLLSFELGCLVGRYKWSFSFGRLGSFLFPLFHHGVDWALDRDMVISFTKVTSSLRGRTLSNRMFFSTVGALTFMLFGSVILVSTNSASWGSIQNNILISLVIINFFGIVFFHADHLIGHLKHQLRLLFQKPL